QIDGSFDDLVSRLKEVDGSAIHLHVGKDDESGEAVFPVNVDADEDQLAGTFTLSENLTADQVRLFENQEYYLVIHTNAYPSGELRGQLDPDAPEFSTIDEYWAVELTTEEQPHDVNSDAQGWAWAILRNDDTFILSGAANHLESDLTEVQLE